MKEVLANIHQDELASGAICTERSLLAREIVMPGARGWRIDYSGVNFRQRIRLNGRTVWWCITWIWFQRFITFRAPIQEGEPEAEWLIEIVVGRFLKIDRFRISINGQDVFVE